MYMNDSKLYVSLYSFLKLLSNYICDFVSLLNIDDSYMHDSDFTITTVQIIKGVIKIIYLKNYLIIGRRLAF